MSQDIAAARVLIASDNADDAAQIRRQIEPEFASVRSSTQPDRFVGDFDEWRPQVLVLAFDGLARAQQYYLGLYRVGSAVQQHPHRTVILCNKDEVRAVYELCKRSYFDDYVLYWPHTHDGPRLAMTIWAACREMTATARAGPGMRQLLAHASEVGELESALGRHVAGLDEHHEALARSAASAEAALSADWARLRQRLESGAEGAVEVRDAAALAREIEQIRRRQAATTQALARGGADALRQWTHSLRQEVTPALAGARRFAQAVAELRPQVLVVDDEPLVCETVGRMLAPRYESVAAGSAGEALGVLRRLRPDVALVDLHMPGLDGVELTRQLKASPLWRELPVLIITGDARRETLADSVAAGAVGFVVKPFGAEALLSKVDLALRGQRPGAP